MGSRAILLSESARGAGWGKEVKYNLHVDHRQSIHCSGVGVRMWRDGSSPKVAQRLTRKWHAGREEWRERRNGGGGVWPDAGEAADASECGKQGDQKSRAHRTSELSSTGSATSRDRHAASACSVRVCVSPCRAPEAPNDGLSPASAHRERRTSRLRDAHPEPFVRRVWVTHSCRPGARDRGVSSLRRFSHSGSSNACVIYPSHRVSRTWSRVMPSNASPKTACAPPSKAGILSTLRRLVRAMRTTRARESYWGWALTRRRVSVGGARLLGPHTHHLLLPVRPTPLPALAPRHSPEFTA